MNWGRVGEGWVVETGSCDTGETPVLPKIGRTHRFAPTVVRSMNLRRSMIMVILGLMLACHPRAGGGGGEAAAAVL